MQHSKKSINFAAAYGVAMVKRRTLIIQSQLKKQFRAMHFSTFFTRVALYACLLSFSLSAVAAEVPRWVRHLPKADNDTYYFMTESATAATEEEARNKAVGLILQHSIMSLGLAFNSQDVENAIATGKLQSLVSDFKIPVKEVCHYRHALPNGGVRVHVLCQVAVAGNIDVQFTEFRHCGDVGSDDGLEVDLRPTEWDYYETETFFSTFQEVDIEPGKAGREMVAGLEDSVKMALVEDLHLTDSALILLVESKSFITKKVGYAVAYIKRELITDKYERIIDEELDIAYNYLKNADSYIKEGNLAEAKGMLSRTKEKLNQIDPYLSFMNAYSSSRSVDRYLEDSKEFAKQVNEKMNQTAGGSLKAKENKIFEYVSMAQEMLKKGSVGDGLRYLYAAQVFWADLKNNGHIMITDAETGMKMNANIYLQNKIKEVLKDIQITCDGHMPGNASEMKLSFRYKEQPINSLNFTYNANSGWSDIYSAKDGWSFLFLPEDNKPSVIKVRIEYRYEDEANFDAELPLLINKYKGRFDYDMVAMSNVMVVDQPIQLQTASDAEDSKNSTDMHQNIVVNRIEEEEHKVATIDSVAYQSIVVEVCEAIRTHNDDYDLLSKYFTPEGYRQYERLIKYGNARIISTAGCRYVALGEEVQCRSVPMQFSFSKGKTQLENVIFVFDQTKKIDGIQFALEERAARNIMGNTDIDETARLALINFMENYKTAFSLQRWDYIESIFSDDAVIITGRKLTKSEQANDNLQLQLNGYVYSKMSKGEYINRLKRTKKEWINIKFGNTNVEQSQQSSMYGICLLQDYYSSNYGDHGYLFLLIDATDEKQPLIKVRTWQPESAGSTPFTMGDYDRLTSGSMNSL